MKSSGSSTLAQPSPSIKMRFSGILGWLVVGLLCLASCSRDRGATKGNVPPVPVLAADVLQETVPIEISAIGNVEAYSTVAVKALVNGALTQVHFQEGKDVYKGDLLFTIDARPFEAALRQTEASLAKNTALLKQMEANLARDEAQASNADVQARRYADLQKEGVVAQELLDQFRTSANAYAAVLRADRAAMENAQALIQADKAALDNARLQLSYCSIRSPINGRTGDLVVHEGNLVKANDTVALITINQIQPIYALFSVPEQNLSDIRRAMATGKLKVRAIIPKEEERPVTGNLSFVDNAVDSATGTIRLKSAFANEEKRLWPGQFVNVVLTLGQQSHAVVVPSRAVQTGQAGQFVFVIKADMTVESRPVATGNSVAGKTVIEKGLSPAEKVVTDGQLRLAPGVKVAIKRSLDDSGEKGS